MEKIFVRCIDEDAYNITQGNSYELLSVKRKRVGGNVAVFYLIKDDLGNDERVPAGITKRLGINTRSKKNKDTQ